MKVARAAFFLVICTGRVRMRPQIVSKSDMTLDVRRICVEKMKLHDASAGLIGKSAIASSRYAQLAVPIVAEGLDAPTFSVQVSQVGYERHKIDDRLGGQPRHRRRADV